MAIRKNKKRIDPRYFMDEKTDVVKEVAYEPGRAVAGIDTGEKRISPGELEREEFEDLAAKFNVEVDFDTPDDRDGKSYAVVTLQNGERMYYYEPEEMYRDLAKRQEMSEAKDREIMIPGYGSMMVSQVERKLAMMLEEAYHDAMRDPPRYSHLDGGVIQALHQALKDNNTQ